MTVQIAVKLPDEILARIDALIADGAFANRSAAVRRGLQALVDAHHRLDVDRAYVEGYSRTPESEAEMREATRLAIESIEDEPWEKWW